MLKRLVIINRPLYTNSTYFTTELARHSMIENADVMILTTSKSFNVNDVRFRSFRKRLGINDNYKIKSIHGADDMTNSTTFAELVEAMNVDDLSEYNQIHFYGGLLASNIRFNKPIKYQQTKINLNIGMTFAMLIKAAIAVKCKLKFGADIVEYCDDPQEFHLNQLIIDGQPACERARFGYTYKNSNLVYDDHFQRGIELNPAYKPITGVIQYNDFIMGYTKNGDLHRRSAEHQVLQVAQSFTFPKIFVRDSKLKINTFIDRDEYLNMVRRSKYTLSIPPYDPESFSVYRTIESLALGCVPLIHPDCKFDDVELTYGVDLTDLIYDPSNDYSDNSYRLQLLNKYQLAFLTHRPII